MSSLFQSISQEVFLNTLWQQQPYIFRQGIKDVANIIDGNELAGLACEESVGSRIISGYEPDADWHCQQGPFNEADFSQLPEKNWTLLVQGVDQWVEDIHSLFAYFNFLPQWRLEDIMASYAPQGGGVGPHFDYYDVFLIQVSGSREWLLGQVCDETSALQHNQPVKLLKAFHTEDTQQLDVGDVLYVPAGKAHWGRALTDDCITLSIGFRAPSEKELLTHALDAIVDQLSENARYQDTTQSIDQHGSKINGAAQQQACGFLSKLTPRLLQSAIAESLGQLVTEPRYQAEVEDEPMNLEECLSLIQQTISNNKPIRLAHPVSTRVAFSDTHLFINGEAYLVDEPFAQSFCEGNIAANLLTDTTILLLAELISTGDTEFNE